MQKHMVHAVILVFALGVAGASAQSTSSPGTPLLKAADLFSARDLQQTASLNGAVRLNPASGRDTVVSQTGVYILSGTYTDTTIVVDGGDKAVVQLVLDKLQIRNSDSPTIYVKSAEKVFVTTTGGASSLQVTGAYQPDGSTKLDSVIFSRSEITLNGVGSLEIVSAQGNGVSTKDDMTITGGSLKVSSLEDALEANDSVRISGGTITIDAGKDGIHAEDNDDNSTGFVYISGGNLTITAGDDGVQGTTITQIDGGTIRIPSCKEGIEGTRVQINGGTISINSKDDGLNAAAKGQGSVMLEVNGGDITVVMASGDTDAFDSNGDLFIRGGTINITARSAFDADGIAQMTGGRVTVNGTLVKELVVQRFGPGRQ